MYTHETYSMFNKANPPSRPNKIVEMQLTGPCDSRTAGSVFSDKAKRAGDRVYPDNKQEQK